jgi:hypothetical protein
MKSQSPQSESKHQVPSLLQVLVRSSKTTKTENEENASCKLTAQEKQENFRPAENSTTEPRPVTACSKNKTRGHSRAQKNSRTQAGVIKDTRRAECLLAKSEVRKVLARKPKMRNTSVEWDPKPGNKTEQQNEEFDTPNNQRKWDPVQAQDPVLSKKTSWE